MADPSRSRMIADGALAAAFIALTQLDIWALGAGEPITPRVVASVLLPIGGLALAFRRRAPLPVFLVTFFVTGVVILAGMPGNIYQFVTLVALYSVAAQEPLRTAQWALGLNLAGVVFYFVRFADRMAVLEMPYIALVFVLVWAAGRATAARSRERELAAERDLSSALADARRARLELQEARVRLAQDLHDLIGHTLNVMLVYAGAGRLALDRDVDEVRAALETIEDTGRSALDELDRVLGILREDGDDGHQPLPGLADLPQLGDGFTGVGLPTSVTFGTAGRPVPRLVGLSVYRLTQEALTNTLKHASATSASVTVTWLDDLIELVVVDDGVGSTAEPNHGLRGMRERVVALGGTVEYGNQPDGGFRVRALLPLTGGGS